MQHEIMCMALCIFVFSVYLYVTNMINEREARAVMNHALLKSRVKPNYARDIGEYEDVLRDLYMRVACMRKIDNRMQAERRSLDIVRDVEERIRVYYEGIRNHRLMLEKAKLCSRRRKEIVVENNLIPWLVRKHDNLDMLKKFTSIARIIVATIKLKEETFIYEN